VKTKNPHKNHSKNNEYVQLCLPFSTEFIIPADDFVRLLGQILEELDDAMEMRRFSRGGCPRSCAWRVALQQANNIWYNTKEKCWNGDL
jgi:hypothetical protein